MPDRPERSHSAAPPAREPLHVLFVEDRPSDVELSLLELRGAGFDVTSDTVDTRAEFEAKLRAGKYDVILSDYRLQGWVGMDALDLMRSAGRNIPFILVTGSLGDEAAVDCVKRGAADYIIKDHLSRLPIAIRQALEQRRLRHSEAVAVSALESSEERYRDLVENSSDAILLMSGGKWTFANRAAARLFGASGPEEVVGRPLLDSVEPAVRREVHQRIEHSAATGEVNLPIERRLVRLDGSLLDVDVLAIPMTDGLTVGAQVIMRDITSRKRMEEALKEREERFRQITENIREAFYMVKADLSELLYVSPAYEGIVGRSREEVYRDLRVFFAAIHPDDLGQVMADIANVRSGAEIEAREFRLLRPDGEVRWVLGRTVPVRSASGEVYRLAGVALDITERKHAEEKLKQSEERFRGVYENTTIGLYRTTPDGRIVMANPALLRMLGFATFDELAKRNLEESGYEPDYPRAEFRRRIENEGVVAGLESAWTKADGATVWVRESARLVRGDDGAALFYDGTVEDITERRRAELDLTLKNVILTTQQETSLDGILVVDEHGQIMSFNQRFVELWGIPPEVAALKSDRRAMETVLDQLQDPAAFVARVEWLYEHREEKSEEEIALKDGRTFDRYSAPMIGPEGNYYGRVWYFRDITARALAEQALKASEARLQSLFGGIDDALFVHDADGRIIDCNEAACRRLGYSREELLAMRTADVDAPEFALGFGERTSQQLLRGRFACEGLHVTKDGRRIPVDINSSLIDYSGTPAVLAVMRDISERRSAEEALRRSEAEHRGLVEHATLGIYRSTAAGAVLSVNPALVSMLGYGSAEEVLQLDIARDIYADPRERDALLTQFDKDDEARAEAQWKRKDGSRVSVRLNVRLVRAPSGEIECFEGLAEDVTEQRNLENQFRQAQRLEAVGRLAGGVAHDFNNVLTAITGYSELLLEDLGPEDPKRPDVLEIRAAAQRAAALTRQLLAFSRKQVLQTRVLDLNEVVRTLEKMLQRLIGEDVKLELALAPAVHAVRADPGQVEQVILNLAVNSRDAMPHGGRITIETANVELDEAYARDHAGAAPGAYVMLAVSDTGIGMDAETRSHIFEPFFTTKEQGKGTGLGLATVYGIVKQSGGYVWVYSEPGRGATFKIYLPRVDAPADARATAPAEPPVAGGRETVLLAEDDPSVRAIVSDVLAQKGYRVLRANDGQAALEMARAQSGRIHLLVTDIVMPGMTGRDLAEALSVERPGLRVLYMSGYTDDAVVRHGVLEEGVPYLQKPFSPRTLASKVREVLDREVPAS